jgi:hypothetical protein
MFSENGESEEMMALQASRNSQLPMELKNCSPAAALVQSFIFSPIQILFFA